MRSNVFLFLPVLLAACSVKLGDSTTGTGGKMSFDVSSSQCGLFGCALDKPILEGSLITIDASGGDATVPYVLKLNPPTLGTTVARASCSCGNGSSSRPIDGASPCNSGETKTCSESADVQTLASGQATLQAFTPNGTLFDAVTFTIAQADKIDTTVSINNMAATAAADGSYAVHIGDAMQIHSVVSAGGKEMLFTEHGLIPTYSDMSIVGSNPMTLGATDIEYSIAKAAGTATTTMTAHGAAVTITFNVTP